jgi:hypothetical protein
MSTRAFQRNSAVPDASLEGESTIQLLRRLADQLSTLLRQEIALATAEVTAALTRLTTGAISVVAGGAVLYAGLLTLLAAAVLGLSLVVPAWLAALLVGAAVSLVGFVLVYRGKKNLSPSSLKPQRTVESLRRDKDILTRSET